MKKTGVLLHITSLPNDYGIGTFGRKAYDFIDFLRDSSQSYWQILPLGPTIDGNSPYLSPSTYAGNPLLIDFDALFDDGLINKNDYIEFYNIDNRRKVNYEFLSKHKYQVLKKAYANRTKVSKEYQKFLEKNKEWINDYALYCALKDYHNNLSWVDWENQYKYRDQNSLNKFEKEHFFIIDEYKFIQFLFYKQFYAMKRYANQNGIEIIGDMPIYVPYDSCDTWSQPKNFLLDESLKPTRVAGVPPDGFAKKGQLWGNPVYDWDFIEKNNFTWWINRINHALNTYDLVRIDHFRGFSAYYSVASSAEDAINGIWTKAPGEKLFNIINSKLDGNRIIAENLGHLDEEVDKLLLQTGYLGMRVLQFDLPDNFYEIINLNPNTILYTGTHDNGTIMGWYKNLSVRRRNEINQLLKITNTTSNKHLRFIEFTYHTKAKIVIIPFQDFYGWDNRARMNVPGTVGNNWDFRILSSDINKDLEKLINELTTANGR